MERNKIIQHKEKPCIKASVVMLPTRDKSILSKAYLANPTYLRYNKNGFEYDSYHNNDNQHLYITLDEPIKENGIWCLNMYNTPATVMQVNVGGKDWEENKKAFRKIIATTDKSLKLGHDDTVPYPKRKSLPQPSQAFISAFVKANGVGFEETLVEVKITGRCKDPMVCLRGCDIYNGTCKHIENMEIKLLIDQNHNTITIHPVKPKVYSREDVMLHLYNLAGNIAFKNSITIDGNYITDWIKRNLK